MIRANKRRPTKNGATSIFTGLLECADCGTKLSLRSSKSYLYKLSDGYEAEQEQLKHEIETLKAEVSEADTEATNVSKLITVTKKYTRIDGLTPEILNTFVDKIVVHECEKKDGKRTQTIESTISQQQAKIHENRLRRWDFCSLAQFNIRSARQVRRPM